MKTRWALVIGRRTVLAMTCWRCGELKQGHEFDRFGRGRYGGGTPYIDRRCKPCRWRHLEIKPTTRPGHGPDAPRFGI